MELILNVSINTEFFFFDLIFPNLNLGISGINGIKILNILGINRCSGVSKSSSQDFAHAYCTLTTQ